MNGKQKAVMWIGLILVAANLVMKWSSIRAIIFSGAGTASSTSPGPGISTVPGIPPTPGGITVPFGGFPLPIPLLSSQSSKPATTLV